MASITGITLELAQMIEASSVISGFLSPTGDLILEMAGGTQINVGPIIAGPSSSTALVPAIVTLKAFDMEPKDVISAVWHTGTVVTTTDAAFGTNALGTVRDVAWAPDGVYLAVAHDSSPYVSIYKRSGDVFTKLSNPSTLPTGAGSGVSWTPDGQYLAISHVNSPRVTVYKRSGDTFTKLSDPSSLPDGNYAAAWSPDGIYLALGCGVTPWYNVYKRSGDTLTKLSVPALAGGGSYQNRSLAWSNGGQYLAVGGGNTAAMLRIVKRNGDAFTELTSAFDIPISSAAAATILDLSFSPDDRFLAAAQTGTEVGVRVYQREGDSFTGIIVPATPGNNCQGVSFSPDGQYLVIASNVTPFHNIYKITDETFTVILPRPGTAAVSSSLPTFSPDGTYIVFAENASPWLRLFKSALDSVTNPVIKVALTP